MGDVLGVTVARGGVVWASYTCAGFALEGRKFVQKGRLLGSSQDCKA